MLSTSLNFGVSLDPLFSGLDGDVVVKPKIIKKKPPPPISASPTIPNPFSRKRASSVKSLGTASSAPSSPVESPGLLNNSISSTVIPPPPSTSPSSRSRKSALLSGDRSTTILTIILERIAKKEKDNQAKLVDNRMVDDIPLPPTNHTNKFMPVPYVQIPIQSQDWLDSNVLIESVVDEEDTIHMELAMLFRTVCESDKRQRIDLHFMSAVRLLQRLHVDLHCPKKVHRNFWVAHNQISVESLASILSRLSSLNKSRNFLMDILRLAARTSTHKENGIINFSHFPAPKRPVVLTVKHSKTRGDAGHFHDNDDHHHHHHHHSHHRHHHHGELAPDGVHMNPAEAVQPQPNSHQKPSSNHNIANSFHSFFGANNPLKIRQSARTSIRMANVLKSRSSTVGIDDNVDFSSLENFEAHSPHKMLEINTSIRSHGVGAESKSSRFTEILHDKSELDDEEHDEFGDNLAPLGTAQRGAATPSRMSSVSSISTPFAPRVNGTLNGTYNRARNSIVGRPSAISLANKYDKEGEEAVLRSWILEWANGLPWKVERFIFGEVNHYNPNPTQILSNTN